MLRRILCISILLAGWLSLSASAQNFDHEHSDFNRLLQTYVDDDGFVNYRGFQEYDDELQGYLQQLAAVTAEQIDEWTEPQQLAYWINAYNAFTIQAIVDNYPIKRGGLTGLFVPKNSILQIDGVWKELEWDAARGSITLDAIEHEILRKEFEEPRIHFAIVCASFSCPDLRNEAYTATKLDTQLNSQINVFLADDEKGVFIDADHGRVKVSKIFDWFSEDFVVSSDGKNAFADRGEEKAGVLNFIVANLPDGERKAFLQKDDFRFGYLDYDWELNEQ